jgi:RNA polymerase sigma factor (sigma-70 family)
MALHDLVQSGTDSRSHVLLPKLQKAYDKESAMSTEEPPQPDLLAGDRAHSEKCLLVSIAQLLELSLELRAMAILEFARSDIYASVLRLREEGAAISQRMNAERLAWAVAFNIHGTKSTDGGASPLNPRGGQGYAERWALDTPWPVVWAALTKPLASSVPGSSSALDELAWSVACEQRNDWQHPASQPVVTSEANRAFEFVYRRNKQRVIGDISKNFGERAGDPGSIADEAWARVFCNYWSIKARRRFLGLSRISTLVCQVARYVAIDIIRERGRMQSGLEDTAPASDYQAGPVLDFLDMTPDPAAGVLREQIHGILRECFRNLPVKQRIVAEMIWFQEISAKRVAEVLHISEPAVSQHLKKAREMMRGCLAARGFIY